MNDTTNSSKSQIVDKIKGSSNILVTVNSSPSVDELSAALGITLLLNKLDKHATAVFSGSVPPAITFLDPDKTFENTVDSLQDFIIALDKEKADHLRYKVEGDVVKIFITPYRTTITKDDLDFSQGDYNVEFVIAIGVKNNDDLDKALSAHGRILHDATVASLSLAGDSQLGGINWSDTSASSYCEMLVSLSDALRGDKNLLDEQIATAFLTGIVAATDRFSNSQTSSKVMTMAAQLMAAGANQQLIATKLEEANEIEVSEPATAEPDQLSADNGTELQEGQITKVDKSSSTDPKAKKSSDAGALTISHEKEGDLDSVAAETASENQAEAAAAAEEELARQSQPVAAKNQPVPEAQAEEQLAAELAKTAPAAANVPSVADLQGDIANASQDVAQAAEVPVEPKPLRGAVSADQWKTDSSATSEPAMGGTLNATTEQAADDARKELEDSRNHTILSHPGDPYINQTPSFQAPLNATAAADQSDEPSVADIFGGGASATAHVSDIAPPVNPTTMQTLANLDTQTRGSDHTAALDAVHAALSDAQSTSPESITAAPMDVSAPVVPPLPPLPPMPDFSTLPPIPGSAPVTDMPALQTDYGALPSANQPLPPSNDPAQFRIPGQ